MGVEDALSEALTKGDPQDSAAIALAFTYARALDEGEELARIGPAFLATLESLLLTPRSRAAVLQKGVNHVPGSALDQLRSKRAERLNRSASVDAPAS